MLFRWLSGPIARVEGADADSVTFEAAYYEKYKVALEEASGRLGWPAEKQATAFGKYQILGENLARYHGMSVADLDAFLMDENLQYKVARRQFYIMLRSLIARRGLAWPSYLFSMWNAGVRFNADYDRAIRRAMKGSK